MNVVEITLLSRSAGRRKYGYYFKQVDHTVLIREVSQVTNPDFTREPFEFEKDFVKVSIRDIDRVIEGLQAMKLLVSK
jgi:hypothetical protein